MEGSATNAPGSHSATATAGAALLLIAGIVSLTFWIYYSFIAGTAASILSMIPGGIGAGMLLMICGVIGLIFAIFALIGGIVAFQKKYWGVALAGSILGLLSLGWFFLGSIFSLIALVLIAISRNEFH